jgi:hypothetical protein
VDQTPVPHNLEMPRCSGLVQPEFIGEFGDIERLLAERVHHEDAVRVREGEAEVGFKLRDFLFEGLINHNVLVYIRMNACLHFYNIVVMVFTIVECVILNFVKCHI